MESDIKPSKLTINLRDGIVQAEGDEKFVRDVYNDFKEQVTRSQYISRAPITALGSKTGPRQIRFIVLDGDGTVGWA